MIHTVHDEQGHKYYDDIFAQGYFSQGYYPLYNQVLKMIEQSGVLCRVLEIGCGVGDLGKMIVDHGHQYRGFDFSPVAVECSKNLCPEGDFSVGDAYNPECYLPHNYDTAVAIEVLEHVDDLRIIENIPVGVRVIASVPNYDDIAHLRLYQDPHQDIIERYRSLLKISNIFSLTRDISNVDTRIVYIFEGMRIKSEPAIFNSSAFNNIGRNDPCPCGSGRKYKKCCLK